MVEVGESERRRAAEAVAIGEPLPYDEDFLYHLSRGSELLIENRVVEAKDELERALGFQPKDHKGQDLLAGVYFRLGVYPRAIELWSALVVTHDDVSLRVNLGLALLKTGQSALALEHLARALAKDPQHERAWRYVGLAEWRVGNLDRAREAFLRGGQASMARRMEELLGSARTAVSTASSDAAVTAIEAENAAAVRALAGDAIQKLAEPDPGLEVAGVTPPDSEAEAAARPRRTTSQWKVVEQGMETVPRAIVVDTRPAVVGAALSSVIRDRSIVDVGAAALRVVPGGALCLRADGAVIGRKSGLRAVRGAVPTEPIARPTRNRRDDGVLGDGDPMVRWAGPSVALFGPPTGEHFMVLRLEGDIVYLVERHVFAFDEALAYDGARLAGESGLHLLQLRGHGTVAVRLERPWSAMPVEGTDARVLESALLGWLGRLFPSEIEGEAGRGHVRFRGEGTLLLV